MSSFIKKKPTKKKRKIPNEVDQFFREIYSKAESADEEDFDVGNDKAGQIVDELRRVTNLDLAGRFLDRHQLPKSVSNWSFFLNQRIRPYLSQRRIKLEDIHDFLEEAEESGAQHILLYSPKEGVDHKFFLSEKRVRSQLRHRGLFAAFDRKTPIRKRYGASLSSVRFDNGDLIIKSVETKIIRREIDAIEWGNGYDIRFTREQKIRRAKLIKLHSTGLLEVRLPFFSSQTVRRHDYQKEADIFLELNNFLITPSNFSAVDLNAFKEVFWDPTRRPPADIFVYRQNLASEDGHSVSFNSKNTKESVTKGVGLQKATAAIMESDGASYDRSEYKWNWREPGRKSPIQISVRISGRTNEMLIRGHCTKPQIDKVISDVIYHGGLVKKQRPKRRRKSG